MAVVARSKSLLYCGCSLLFRELITNVWEELDHLASRDVIGHVVFDSP